MPVEFKMCHGCTYATEYKVPTSVLRQQIQQARMEFMRPKALLLEEVLEGKNTRVTRTCGRGGIAFGSTLCGSESEFKPKT